MMLDLRTYKAAMDKCCDCGFCQATCPVFLEDLLETHVARARMGLIRACLLEGTHPVTERLREVVGRCLLCTSCVQTCPARLPVDEIVVAARHQLQQQNSRGRLRRRMTRKFMKERGFRGLVGKAGRLARSMGLGPEELPPPARKRFEELRRGVISPKGEIRARVAYYVGCATNTFYPETALDVVRVLAHNGIEVLLPEGLVCCGMPALGEGDLETAQELVRTNIRVLSRQDVDAIVTDCTSCGLVLKTKTVKVLPEDDELREQATLLSPKIHEITDYLSQIGLTEEPSSVPGKLTYHMPCHRSWTPTMDDAPRNILRSIPETEFVEMEYPERCCGGGGTFFMDYKELSQSIRSHKIEDIDHTGARTVVTQCPSCRSYMTPMLKEREVMHPVSFLARAYGFRPDA